MQLINQQQFNTKLHNADSATLELQEYVAQAMSDGATRADISDAVTRFVAAEHRVPTREGQRGLTFAASGKAAKAADNRRQYLLRLCFSVPRSGAGKRAETDPVERILKAAKKLTAAQRRRLIAKLA
jgi:hypothetical protein